MSSASAAREPPRYEFKGEWRPAEVYHETIAVKGGSPVELDVTVTHHGPIIAGDPGQGLRSSLPVYRNRRPQQKCGRAAADD